MLASHMYCPFYCIVLVIVMRLHVMGVKMLLFKFIIIGFVVEK